MFERINVNNYRGFNDVTVGGLGRINLVAGRNNAGKTALLEAIWLLCGAADPRMAVHSHIVRLDRAPGERPGWMAETYWRPFFHGLDTGRSPTVSGYHASIGNMSLEIEWERSRKTEISRAGGNGTLEKGPYSLKFTYGDSNAGYMEGNVRKTMDQFEFDKKTNYLPFDSTILLPGNGDVRDDAVRLGRLRKQKLGAGFLDALRVIEPRLQHAEDNASSGVPMIHVDVGLPELVPLPVMGAGMTHLARIVLAVASVRGGVVLVDEIENGLHHSILPDVWRAIGKAAERFNVQMFATTHSFECIEAAYEALGEDGFRLHRLEAGGNGVRCVTYAPDEVETAIRHTMELR